MKVVIDTTLAKNHVGGMGVFIKNLTTHLTAIDKHNEYIYITNPVRFNPNNIYSKILSVIKEYLWYQTACIKKLKQIEPDLIYFPNPPIPLMSPFPVVLTIPDMAFYTQDKIHKVVKYFLYLTYFLSAQKAKVIITISNHSKNDIVKILKVKPQKVKVIPLAIPDYFQQKASDHFIKQTLTKYHIKTPYILCDPGTFLARKNVNDLIKAIYILAQRNTNPPNLVLVGQNNGPDYKKLLNLVTKLNMSDKVIFTGYIKPKALVALYKAAKLHVYPSRYEGFGLPPLQAMGMGIPSIVYNSSSLPEVVGNAGIIFSNYKQLTNAINLVLTNQKLYTNLVKKGLLRSKLFTWEKCAGTFISVFNSIST